MTVLLLLLAGCGLQRPAPATDTADLAQVEVRVLGEPAEVASAQGCGPRAEGPGLEHVLVWSPQAEAAPRRERLSWTACGPDQQAMVLPLGSELRLENHRDQALELAWTLAGKGDQARLAPGGTRTLHLDAPAMLRLSAGGPGAPGGQDVVVVVGGDGAVTDALGQATLGLAAQGMQELWMYHPTVGMRRARVDLVRGERVHLEVELGLDRAAHLDAALRLPPS